MLRRPRSSSAASPVPGSSSFPAGLSAAIPWPRGSARGGEGAVAAVRVSDTLKEASVEDPSLVARTLPRDGLWRAQTPQGFPREVLERAHAAAPGANAATDDAALVERLGVPVRLVPDSPRNLKVTTAEDLALAELLAGRGE